jgi:hypothetical protein
LTCFAVITILSLLVSSIANINWGYNPGKKMLNSPIPAIKTRDTRATEINSTVIGPIFIPSLESAKKRINPAPAAGMGPSDERLRFDFGMSFPQANCLESLNPNRF